MQNARRNFHQLYAENLFEPGYGFQGEIRFAFQDAADLLRPDSDKIG
jgi:hypothetical protein